jgi:hypothetical protein
VSFTVVGTQPIDRRIAVYINELLGDVKLESWALVADAGDSCHCLRVSVSCPAGQILSVITKAAPYLRSFRSGIKDDSSAYLSGDLRVNVTELLTPPDVEITSVNESGRTFMRPDGTTYTKE